MPATNLKRTPLVGISGASVLAIGPWTDGEFLAARSQIDGSAQWQLLDDFDTARPWLEESDELVGTILVAQSLPGQLSTADIDSIRLLAPLAQIVVITGTWCEGEIRTGKPVAGVLRLHWHELPQWWRTRFNQGSPWSYSLEGALHPRNLHPSLHLQGKVAVYTPALASFEALSGALSPTGLECEWHRYTLPHGTLVGIWDGAQLDDPELLRLKSFAAPICEHGGSLVVLLDFPRKEHFAQLKDVGRTAILGKPYIISDLITAIAHFM